MEDLCRDFGSSVPDSRYEGRWWWILFNIISSFCGLKCMNINKTNKSKNIRQIIEFTFPQQKEGCKKKTCLNHVTLFVTWLLHFKFITLLAHKPYTCDTSIDAHWRQLHKLCAQQSTKISKKLKKSQNSLKITCLSRTSQNCHARNLKSLSVHHIKITKILAPSWVL
jgi:hypothetical protein